MKVELTLGREIPVTSRILVAMSGGVDSALTAVLLRREGFECVGINMRTYHPNEADVASGRKFQTCCSPEDAGDARAVALGEDFPFYVLDLEKEFHAAVVQPFIRNYLQGLTPNPCVLCNNHLKLGVLLEKARLYGCDYVATGHYARVIENGVTGRTELHRAADLSKDQTYYLFGLRQDQLQRFICPLGGLQKSTVRQLAREYGLEVAEKPDSMEICFVPGNDYRTFLRGKVEAEAIQPGAIVTIDGDVLGRHEGIAFYTIGQRKGLGISSATPMYVVDILPEENLVVVGAAEQTMSDGLVCERMNWVAIESPRLAIEASAQIRYRHAAAPCVVTPLTDGRFEVRFQERQRSVTPGQAVVFYEGDSVLGGGWIVSRI
ncbi:MAG: tRNA 2-thiouridine(34) synthase MnmA [Candidatus Sumerlaeaceae bacterium]